MKHNIFPASLIPAIFVLSVSCHRKLAPQQTVVPQASNYNKADTDLLGACTRSQLEQAPFNTWFQTNYAHYKVDSTIADQLRSQLADRTFTIFMGTWCGDSKREVPRIFRILDYCGVAPSRIRLIMVSHADSTYKQSPGHEERGMDIFKVPDLLVYYKGREEGRIIESPVVSLEKDLLDITADRPYIPHYQGAALLMRKFRDMPLDDINANLPALAAQLKPLLSSKSELYVYGYVLKAAGDRQKADITEKLNALIFPQ